MQCVRAVPQDERHQQAPGQAQELPRVLVQEGGHLLRQLPDDTDNTVEADIRYAEIINLK